MTAGPTWVNTTNWGKGEPCTNGWAGVYCCPAFMPHLIGANLHDPELQYCSSDPSSLPRRRLHYGQPHVYPGTWGNDMPYPGWFPDSFSHASDARNVTLSAIPAEGTHFCATGTSFGDDRDLSRCSVVQLLMSGNNMSGVITPDMITIFDDPNVRQTGFNNLQAIDMENNHLEGAFPIWITQLPQLHAIHMQTNSFSLVDSDEAAIKAMCERPTMDCTGGGLPGYNGSCLAFGASVVMLQPGDQRCHQCETPSTVTANYYLLLFIPAMIAVAIYVMLVYTVAQGGVLTRISFCRALHQTSLKRWVGCSCIMIMHFQLLLLMRDVRSFWPVEVENFVACLSLDYTCFQEKECVTALTTHLSENLDAQASINNMLWIVMILPPAIIVFLVGFRKYFTWRRRNDLEKGIIRDRNTFLQKVVEGFNDFVVNTMPVFEFICSVLIPLFNAWTLRISYQLIYWPTTVFPIGALCLLSSQPVLYVLYGRDAAVAQRERKAAVQHERVPRDMLRLAYLTQPFKDRAQIWQLLFLLQNFTVWLGTFISRGSFTGIMPKDSNPATPNFYIGHTLVVLAILGTWIAHSYVEPWASSYMNAASSRLYACHMVTLGFGGLWNNYRNDTFLSPICHAVLIFTAIVAPLLTIVYLFCGLVVSKRAEALSDGIVTKSLPLWIRGMRWEDLPLSAASIAIPCIFDGTPSAQGVYDALKGNYTGVDLDKKVSLDDEDDGTRRGAEFKRSFDRLLSELAVGQSGSSLTSQVRKYGRENVLRAHVDSLALAQKRVEARLTEYKKSLDLEVSSMNLPPSAAPAAEDEADDDLDAPDYDSAAAQLTKQPSSGTDMGAETSKDVDDSDLAMAALTRLPPSSACLGTDASQPQSELAAAALTRLPLSTASLGGNLEEAALTRLPLSNASLGGTLDVDGDDEQGASEAPEGNAPSGDVPREAGPAAAPSLDDDTVDDEAADLVEPAKGEPPASPPAAQPSVPEGESPPSPPPSPGGGDEGMPQRQRSGLAQGTCLLSSSASRAGLADGTLLTRASSASRAGLADGTLLTRGASSVGAGSGLDAATLLARSRSSRRGLADGTVLACGEDRGAAGLAMPMGGSTSAGLTDGTVLTRGETSSVGVAAGTILAGATSEAAGLADGTILGGGAANEAGLAGDTVLAGGAQSASIVKGTVLAGGAIGQSLVDGTSLAGGPPGSSMADGTVLGGGKAGASVAEGTILRGGSVGGSLAADTVLQNGRPSSSLTAGLHLGAAPGLADGTALLDDGSGPATKRREAEAMWSVPKVYYDATGDPLPWWEDGDGEYGSAAKVKKRRARPARRQTERTASGRLDAVQRVSGRAPTLEREPQDPPKAPDVQTDALTPTRRRTMNDFLLSLVEWLTSPAQDVSEAKATVSPWPAKANHWEPSDLQMDEHMRVVLRILEKANYHGGSGGGLRGDVAPTRPLIELGYQVVLCLHMHRNARAVSDRAAKVHQRWYLTVVDWKASRLLDASAGPPPLSMPNAYLEQWSGRPLRVKEPVYAGGIWSKASDHVVKMVNEGRGVVYDESMMSVLALPPGVRCRTLHRSLQQENVGRSADLLWADAGPLMRNLCGSKAALPFAEPLADVKLNLGIAPGLLLQELSRLAEEVVGSSDLAREAGSARQIARKVSNELQGVVNQITQGEEGEGPTFGSIALAGHFPKVIRAEVDTPWWAPEDQAHRPPGGVSIHLCASDTRRLAPDPSREIVVWLTIVDLNQYNPVHASEGGLLTPRNEHFDVRPTYVVPGELACPLSVEEIEARLEAEEQQKVQQAEEEIRSQMSTRLARARASKDSKIVPAAQSPRRTFKDEKSLAAAAGALADAQLSGVGGAAGGAAPPTLESDDDDDDDDVRAIEEENRRLRSQRLDRAPLATPEPRPAGVDRVAFGV